MPLKIVAEDSGDRPAIFCDACGKEIERVQDGNYHWGEPESEGGGAKLYFSHKACCAAVDHHFKTPNALDLEDLLYFLANNLDFDMEMRRKHYESIGMFGIGLGRRKKKPT